MPAGAYGFITNEKNQEGLFLRTPFAKRCGGVNYQTVPPGRSNMPYF